jgi:hypothetical protein
MPQFREMDDKAPFLEALAHAYQLSGNTDKAIAAYDSMLRSIAISLSWEPQQRWLEAVTPSLWIIPPGVKSRRLARRWRRCRITGETATPTSPS